VDVKSKEGKGATFYIKLPGHIEHEKGLLVKDF
jgi:signal transduction histidine kinase